MKRNVLICTILLACGLSCISCASTITEDTTATEGANEVSVSETDTTVVETESVEETESTEETEPTVEESTIEETVPAEEVKIEFNVTAKEATMYATGSCNLRKEPATTYEVAGKLSKNDEVKVTGQADTGWYEIEVNGIKVYVSNKYLSDKKAETVAKTETVTPAPTAEAKKTTEQPKKSEPKVAADRDSAQTGDRVWVEEDKAWYIMRDDGLLELDPNQDLTGYNSVVAETINESNSASKNIPGNLTAELGLTPGESVTDYWTTCNGVYNKSVYYCDENGHTSMISDEVISKEEYDAHVN